MDLVRNVLMDKKYFESIDEVEQLLQDNEVNFNSVIQSLIMSKEIFPSEEDARLWAREHGFLVEQVSEEGDSWHVTQLEPSEFIIETMKVLDIVTGVQAVVGVLRQDAVEGGLNDVFLSLRNEEGIKLNENLPHIIELAKIVNGTHVNYGKVEINKEMLESFARNFSESVVGVDLMIDYDHEQRGAAGWIKSVFISMDGTTLFGEVKWTPNGAKCLGDREFRYFSPEFTLNYVHPHTGVSHGPTMLGGGLVNRPFLKMDAIVNFKEQNKNKEVINMETIALNEHKAAISVLENQINDYKLSEEKVKNVVVGQKEEIEKLSVELSEIKAEKVKAEKEAKHEKLFNENKINKAQLVALNEGKELLDVLSLSETMNPTPKGVAGTDTNIVLSEQDVAACETIGVSKEDFIKYNY